MILGFFNSHSSFACEVFLEAMLQILLPICTEFEGMQQVEEASLICWTTWFVLDKSEKHDALRFRWRYSMKSVAQNNAFAEFILKYNITF